jgi:hypothetical protein
MQVTLSVDFCKVKINGFGAVASLYASSYIIFLFHCENVTFQRLGLLIR